jgi:small subunit ribosomal protein S20
MPNIKSAEKRMRTSAIRNASNRAAKSAILTARQALLDAVGKGDRAKAEELLRAFSSVVDNAARKGQIKRGAASRKKSRAARTVALVKAAV